MRNYKFVAAMIVMGTIIAGGLFAQEQEKFGGKKNFVSADVGVLVAGARYERFLTQNISVGADFYWANSFIIFNELDAGVFGRYYIWKGLFAELGLGYHIHTGVEDVKYKSGGTEYTATWTVSNSGFGISPGLGWKFDPGKAGGFFVEPAVSVPITIGKKTAGWADQYSEIGASVGFVLYCGLGWAF